MPPPFPLQLQPQDSGKTFCNYPLGEDKVPFLPPLDRSGGTEFTFVAIGQPIVVQGVEDKSILSHDGLTDNFKVSLKTTFYNVGRKYWYPVDTPGETIKVIEPKSDLSPASEPEPELPAADEEP